MCATVPHLTLLTDLNQSWGYKLAPLLDAGVPILVYNGDQDYICNYKGAEMWTNALVWSGQEKYNQASFEEYRPNNNFVGMVKNAGNLTMMIVFDAGHMVPMD
jgi:cathepsin A (carboxypeptidase C)